MNFKSLFNDKDFASRHVGPSSGEMKGMLDVVGCSSEEEFLDKTVPQTVRYGKPLEMDGGLDERSALDELKAVAGKNKIIKSYIGRGYYPTVMPTVILRNVLENPGWYTAYTPYQAEVSQGRLEALMNFQQVCIDLAGLPLAGASLLDEATAAAEAMAMARRVGKSKSETFFVDENSFPQTIDVIKTRAKYMDFDVKVAPLSEIGSEECFGAYIQYVGKNGEVQDVAGAISKVKEKGGVAIVGADVMSLVLLKSPGSLGADIALGSTQRFGVPMSFGGPHAAFFAFKDEHKRQAPGRIIGVSKDKQGKRALRMALQTREQHIRREKANSNICTSQVLLANLAGFYAVYHGPEGLKRIATRISAMAGVFKKAVEAKGFETTGGEIFDTVTIKTPKARELQAKALQAGYNVYAEDGLVSVAFSETSDLIELADLVEVFTGERPSEESIAQAELPLTGRNLRTDSILDVDVFRRHHSETAMLRYIKTLENKDVALTRSMISLGSCTMKLNATSEMIPITWPEFTEIHPFAPKDQAQGYLELIERLKEKLKVITGFDDISFQPNSGAQGEYAGMLTIRRYLEAKGQAHRNVCLIPKSAHGTNPASAHMAGMKIVTVESRGDGSVDVDDLKAKAEANKDNLAAIMITYPSTHGAFEADIVKICEIMHANGAQVYMDGANMNAQVGLMKPAIVGADVLHMNLHKTFAIPHGGGGPGVGPIGVKSHLQPYLPNHVVVDVNPKGDGHQGAVSASPYGSAGILPITWMYIRMMGGDGLKKATTFALLNANYVADKLKDYYPILYRGPNGMVAHECIVDLRPLKEETGITEVDVAKRLIDYGFHAPTMSFPVPGTLMVEPTESEPLEELDRFIDAMISIRREADKVKSGAWPKDDNPLVNAPHPAHVLTEGEWKHPYSMEEAVFPNPALKADKYWPPVSRVDDVFGDRHVICDLKTEFNPDL